MEVKQLGSEAEKMVSSFSSKSLGLWQRKQGDREVASEHQCLMMSVVAKLSCALSPWGGREMGESRCCLQHLKRYSGSPTP